MPVLDAAIYPIYNRKLVVDINSLNDLGFSGYHLYFPHMSFFFLPFFFLSFLIFKRTFSVVAGTFSKPTTNIAFPANTKINKTYTVTTTLAATTLTPYAVSIIVKNSDSVVLATVNATYLVIILYSFIKFVFISIFKCKIC